jgi:hypothetical protein
MQDDPPAGSDAKAPSCGPTSGQPRSVLHDQKTKSLREHALACIKVAPAAAAVSTLLVIATVIYIRPPLWAIAVPALIGLGFSLYLPFYWRRPAPWKFVLFITVMVVGQNAVCQRITSADAPFLSFEFWAPVVLFLSVYCVTIFAPLTMRRKFILRELKIERQQ